MEFRVELYTAKNINDMFSLCETPNTFIDTFCYSKIHFHQSGPFKLIKTIFLHILLGLSLVWNYSPKGSHTKGTTKRLIIAYDENKDNNFKEQMSEYHLVY